MFMTKRWAVKEGGGLKTNGANNLIDQVGNEK